jgi:hypothetical protein
MAVWQKSREIRFRRRFPRDLWPAHRRRYYKRLIAGFERIFYFMFFFSSDQHVREATTIERQSFRLVKDAKRWYTEPGVSESSAAPQAKAQNVILPPQCDRQEKYTPWRIGCPARGYQRLETR